MGQGDGVRSRQHQSPPTTGRRTEGNDVIIREVAGIGQNMGHRDQRARIEVQRVIRRKFRAWRWIDVGHIGDRSRHLGIGLRGGGDHGRGHLEGGGGGGDANGHRKVDRFVGRQGEDGLRLNGDIPGGGVAEGQVESILDRAQVGQGVEINLGGTGVGVACFAGDEADASVNRGLVSADVATLSLGPRIAIYVVVRRQADRSRLAQNRRGEGQVEIITGGVLEIGVNRDVVTGGHPAEFAARVTEDIVELDIRGAAIAPNAHPAGAIDHQVIENGRVAAVVINTIKAVIVEGVKLYGRGAGHDGHAAPIAAATDAIVVNKVILNGRAGAAVNQDTGPVFVIDAAVDDAEALQDGGDGAGPVNINDPPRPLAIQDCGAGRWGTPVSRRVTATDGHRFVN